MITAVDTNVLLDLFVNDPKHGLASKQSIRQCLLDGQLVACDVVVAEVGGFFPSDSAAESALSRLGVLFTPIEMSTTLSASQYWKKYRKRGGRRLRILPDFLIGAHALHHAERLLTRDSRFFHRYFPGLRILDPSKNH